MNRKLGYGVVTVRDLICVDKRGRTARHIEGNIRVDYMESGHYWLIMSKIVGFGSSIPTSANLATDTFEGVPVKVDDVGEIWIPDRMVSSIRWYKQEW